MIDIDEPDPAFLHCVSGMYIGSMTPRPMSGEFGAVLTLSSRPGTVEDGIRHRHLPIPATGVHPMAFDSAADWVEDQLVAERSVLVRSEGGQQRPALVVALVVVRLGGTYIDAIDAVRRRGAAIRQDVLTDLGYRALLRTAASVPS